MHTIFDMITIGISMAFTLCVYLCGRVYTRDDSIVRVHER